MTDEERKKIIEDARELKRDLEHVLWKINETFDNLGRVEEVDTKKEFEWLFEKGFVPGARFVFEGKDEIIVKTYDTRQGEVSVIFNYTNNENKRPPCATKGQIEKYMNKFVSCVKAGHVMGNSEAGI